MKTPHLTRLAGVALWAAATTLSTHAATVEVRVDGVITGHVAGPLPTSSGAYNIPGYERSWSYGTAPLPSPFGMATLSQPFDYVFGNRSLVIADLPVSMRFTIDTDRLPGLAPGSNANLALYENRLYSSYPTPTVSPYTPWMTGSLSFNGVTQNYTGDFGAMARLAENPYTQASSGIFELWEFTSAAGLAPWQANVFDVSSLRVDFSFAADVLNGLGLEQDFSLSNPSGLAGLTATFNVYETTWVNGARQNLAQDIGWMNVTSFSMHTLGGAGGPGPSPVPEPASGLMLLGGLLTRAARRRRAE
jgi:hypothetical protein